MGRIAFRVWKRIKERRLCREKDCTGGRGVFSLWDDVSGTGKVWGIVLGWSCENRLSIFGGRIIMV